MGKRSDKPKIPKDFYPTTDPKALPENFLRFIRGKTYAEPCCGVGDLVGLLEGVSTCLWASDLEDRGYGLQRDALCLSKEDIDRCDLIVTNPPYTRGVLLPMIDHFISLKPTWLLLPADLAHNQYFAPYMSRCSRVVSIGRLCWFPQDGKKVNSTENYSWYFWQMGASEPVDTVFYTRG